MENIRKLIRMLSANLRAGKSAPDFWGLVRSLEKAAPAMPKIGYAEHPSYENVRFGQKPFLHFPSSDIAEIIEGGKANADATIYTYFLGLLGVNGPMPMEFTNYVFQRSHNHYDNTWRRFLDIIHHRFHVLYYRAFADRRQAISFDRKESDRITGIVKSLVGIPHQSNYVQEQEYIALSFAHRFAFMSRSRSGLELMIQEMFKIPVNIIDNVLCTYDISHEDRAFLAQKNSVLGSNMQIGRRYKSKTQKFTVCIGPVNFDFYRYFMLSKEGLTRFTWAIKFYLDRFFYYDIHFTLESATIPHTCLGTAVLSGNKYQNSLGYSCWLGILKNKLTTHTINGGII